MARVAVVMGPLEVAPDFIDYPYFADLGAVQVAAVLRDQGHAVELVDALAMKGATLAPGPHGRARLGAPIEAVRDRLVGFDAYVVALTPFHRPPARDPMIAALVAGRDAPVVLADLYQSGQHVVDVASASIVAAYPEIAALVRYEAELVIADVIERSLNRERPCEIVIGSDARLDELPLPAWDLVDFDAYFRFQRDVVSKLGRGAWAFPIDVPSAPVITSRGCPYRCAHCSSNPSSRLDGELIAPKTQRRLSLDQLDRLLLELRSRGVRRAHILDELLNVNEAHFDGVLDLLDKHRMAFEIPNGLRADHVKPHHLARLKGKLTTLSVSAESGSQRVLDAIVDKDLDLTSIERVAADARDAGVATMVHFMIGLPGETAEEINTTLEYAVKLFDETGAIPSVQFATPLPGTRLEKLAKATGRSLPVVDEWGPRFQKEPTISSESVSLAALAAFKWTFDQRIAAMHGPKKIILNATYKCNNRCTFCATGTRTQVDGDLTRQRELLVKYRRLGVDLLDIDGGEPTLNANLIPLIAFARKIGYQRVNVTTNARMASYYDFAKQLVSSGVTSVLISIHGPDAATHAQNVGVAEAFDQTVQGARNIVRAVRENKLEVELGANVTLTKSNYRALGEIADLALEIGLPWLNVQFLTPFGRATRFVAPDTEAAAAETRSLIDRLGDKMKIQVINLPFCFMPGYEQYLLGDLLKLERHMLFVNNDEVNLFEYLRDRRVKKPVCATCPRAVFCGGFFELDEVPEPTWLVAPEDLVRPIREEIPRAAR